MKFAGIIREEAPNVRVIFCGGWGLPDGHVEQEDAFKDCYAAADLWSCDTYLALHYGWPYNIAEIGGTGWKCDSVQLLVDRFTRTHKRACELAGVSKPMVTCEFNTDGDVTGPRAQGESVVRFAHYWRDNKVDWFKGISLYQFRDRGRQRLEIEDPNNNAVGI